MIHTMFLRCAYTNIPFIYRLSTVYVPYINRISTVVDSGGIGTFYLPSRVGEEPGNIVGIVMVDARGRGVEIVIGCCLGTKHAIAHFNHIQIHLHNALLAPKELYQDREICLYRFAQVGARVESEDVLCRLLGDCTASADNTPIALILLIRIGDSIPIEATVLVELGVLVVNDSCDEVGGDVLQWRPLVLYL